MLTKLGILSMGMAYRVSKCTDEDLVEKYERRQSHMKYFSGVLEKQSNIPVQISKLFWEAEIE